jgi:hypothetical protein
MDIRDTALLKNWIAGLEAENYEATKQAMKQEVARLEKEADDMALAYEHGGRDGE